MFSILTSSCSIVVAMDFKVAVLYRKPVAPNTTEHFSPFHAAALTNMDEVQNASGDASTKHSKHFHLGLLLEFVQMCDKPITLETKLYNK